MHRQQTSQELMAIYIRVVFSRFDCSERWGLSERNVDVEPMNVSELYLQQ